MKKLCSQCEEPFDVEEGPGRPQIYCSDRCANRAAYLRRKAGDQKPRKGKPTGEVGWHFDEEGQLWFGMKSGRRTRGEVRQCLHCGADFNWRKSGSIGHGLYCSRAHANAQKRGKQLARGVDHPNWKGGHVTKDGYRVMRADREDGTRKLVGEHRLVMEKHLGRALLPTEEPHHRNGDKKDNKIGNLELRIKGYQHPKGQSIRDMVEHWRKMLAIYEPLVETKDVVVDE